ncbi:hypothetical protein GWI33_006871 [Rhynchophorus ferrugineus]|uniref:Uncharacterized protein n=1 Tax=Rhynchophorus ferrugineus TaxID=354439 RepID=A0A834II96_RHYFE|nr:hypothetical protein GWI33_006871 [Rhynchophorus ferrugineus]
MNVISSGRRMTKQVYKEILNSPLMPERFRTYAGTMIGYNDGRDNKSEEENKRAKRSRGGPKAYLWSGVGRKTKSQLSTIFGTDDGLQQCRRDRSKNSIRTEKIDAGCIVDGDICEGPADDRDAWRIPKVVGIEAERSGRWYDF